MGRPLTTGERAMATALFGSNIDLDEIEVDEGSSAFQAIADARGTPQMAVTPYGDPTFSTDAYRTDFSDPGVPLGLKELFMHELAHSVQHQNGMKVPNRRSENGSYDYEAIFDDMPFHELPPEAQAEFMEDLWRSQNDPNWTGRPTSDYLERLPSYFPGGEATDSTLGDLDNPPYTGNIPTSADYPQDVAPITSLPGVSPGGGGIGGGGLEPLVFDLDASGTIDLVSIASGVHFDFWGDGFAEKVGWAAPTDGMLAIDLDDSGAIDSGAELFGSEYPLSFILESNWTQFLNEENGFAKLAKYDLVANGGNNDGAITSADAVWSDLVMWQDANSDGVSQSGELLTLSSFGITSIDVSDYELENFNGLSSGTPFSRIIQGNTVTHTGTFTMNGVEREVVDVWFDSDLTNTFYTGAYTVDPITWVLPNVRGYGMVANLDIAMNLNEDLLGDVTDFVTGRSFEDLFDDASADVEGIMLAWAGLDASDLPDFDYSKHGMFESMKEYWFLRKFMGQDNDGLGTWFDQSPYLPGVDEGTSAILQAYSNVLNSFSARILFQSGGWALFEDGVSYNAYTDEFEGTFALSQDAVDDLEVAAGTSGDAEDYWRSVALFIENTMGLSELSGTELGWLNDAVDDSTSGALDWSDIVATLSVNTVLGTSGADTLYGTDYDDFVTGDNSLTSSTDTGNDILYGGAGNDHLYGGQSSSSNTADTLSGGLGDDILQGGRGNDTYIYDYGHDVIIEQSQASYTDVIQLAAGITTSDVSIHFARLDFNSTQPHLFLEIEGRGTITIKTQIGVAANTLIDQIQFNGGPTWYMTSTPIHFHGTNGEEIIYSTGFTGNNFVFGYDGDDILNGNTGNDTLYGGGGDDDLRGDNGSDIYMVSSGTDLIRESAGTDKILIPDGYTIDDIAFQRVEAGGTYGMYDEMRIVVDGLGSLTVINTFANSTSSTNVETLELFGGTQVNLLTQTYTVIGTAGNDSMYGTPTAWGQPNDIYLFGTGTDIVNESYGGYDILEFGEGVAPGSITLSRVTGNNWKDLLVSDGSGNSIRFVNHFTDTSTMLNSLEKIEFANGTSWIIANLEIEAVGTSNADTIFCYDYGDVTTRDVVYAAGGNDQVQGANGDDELHGGDGTDNLSGGTGVDVIYGDDGNDTIGGDSGNDTLYGGVGNDNIQGGTEDDVIDGGDGDDSINGQGGTDTASYASASSAVTVSLATGSAQNTVGAGTDTLSFTENLTGSSYGDTLTGNTSVNVIKGGDGNDTIDGNSGADTLYGDGGNDTLTGGSQNDILYGGAGTDSLTGGSHADTFVFELASAFSNQDTIADFSTGQSDKLDIHDIIDVEFDPVTEAISQFVDFTNSGGNSIMSIDRDGTGTTYGFVNVATLSGVINLDETTLYNNGNLLAA